MKNKTIKFIDMYADSINLISNISNSHKNVADLSRNINSIYGEISISEDIALNKAFSIYNTAKAIMYSNKSNLIIESFLSHDYFDMSFPTDNQLNIDTQNGDLTLPIDSTTNINIDSIIIESDSNGYISNVDSNKIESIINGGSSSLFKYEKVSNIFSVSDLCLAITIKTDTMSIANGLYIQLYTENNIDYAKIGEIETSEDGETWNKVSYSSSTIKADHYIRFDPVELRFLRIRFYQSSYSTNNTGFGIRHNYLIGLRQISIKRTKYKSNGSYMSIPFTGKKAISSIQFSSLESGSIRYFISANNGTKLVNIKNGDILQLQNEKMGLRNDTDISSVRLAIQINKDDIGINLQESREYNIVNQQGQYFIKNVPKTIKAYIGRHVSYGEMSKYAIQGNKIDVDTSILDVDDGVLAMFNLSYIPYYNGIHDDIVLLLNGTKVKNLRTIYDIIPHQNKLHSILIVKNDKLLNNSSPLTIMFNKIVSNLQEIKLPKRSFFLTKDSFLVESNNQQLGDNGYTIIDNGLETKIIISNDEYSKDNEYSISYFPLFELPEISVDTIKNNSISLGSMEYIQNSQICFDYKYNNGESNYLIDYYTPICKEYRIEML